MVKCHAATVASWHAFLFFFEEFRMLSLLWWVEGNRRGKEERWGATYEMRRGEERCTYWSSKRSMVPMHLQLCCALLLRLLQLRLINRVHFFVCADVSASLSWTGTPPPMTLVIFTSHTLDALDTCRSMLTKNCPDVLLYKCLQAFTLIPTTTARWARE